MLVALIFMAGIFFQTMNAHIPVSAEPISFIEDLPGGAYLNFAGKFGGKLTPQDIAKQKTLGVKGCAEGSVIFKFTLYVKWKNGHTNTYRGTSNKLTTEMHNTLKKLSPGDEFGFGSIKAHLPQNKGVVKVLAKAFYVVGEY